MSLSLIDINSLSGDQLRSSILIPFTTYNISAGTPFRQRMGCSFTQQTPAQFWRHADHFLWHTPSTDYSEWGRALHTERIQGHGFVALRLLNHIVLVSSTPPLSTSDGPVISHFFPLLWWMRCQAQDVFWSLQPRLLKLRLNSTVAKMTLSVIHTFPYS